MRKLRLLRGGAAPGSWGSAVIAPGVEVSVRSYCGIVLTTENQHAGFLFINRQHPEALVVPGRDLFRFHNSLINQPLGRGSDVW